LEEEEEEGIQEFPAIFLKRKEAGLIRIK